MSKLSPPCTTCLYYTHPEWAVLIPNYMICSNPKADGVGRIDILRAKVERTTRRTAIIDSCGPEGSWWEGKQCSDSIH